MVREDHERRAPHLVEMVRASHNGLGLQDA